MSLLIHWWLVIAAEIAAAVAVVWLFVALRRRFAGFFRHAALAMFLLVAWLMLFHGRELFAHALAAIEPAPQAWVIADEKYCREFDLVVPGYEPVGFEGSDAPSGRLWLFRPPFRYIDTTWCSQNCAIWLTSGLPRYVFGGTEQSFRVPYQGLDSDLSGLRAARVADTRECARSVPDVSGWSFPSFLRSVPSTSGEASQWNDDCLVEESIAPSAPLLLTVFEIDQRELGFGLWRVDVRSQLVEHFSGEVLAQSHMVMFRGASPTLQPFVSNQHVYKGRLLSSYDLHSAYRERNCGEQDGANR